MAALPDGWRGLESAFWQSPCGPDIYKQCEFPVYCPGLIGYYTANPVGIRDWTLGPRSEWLSTLSQTIKGMYSNCQAPQCLFLGQGHLEPTAWILEALTD